MAVNKVEANGETLIDLTNDTAGASDVLEGKTLHLASGKLATGTYRPSAEIEARLRATVGHSNINLFNEKYRQGSAGNFTDTRAVTSKTLVQTAIGQKHIFHNFNQDYTYAIYGLNSAGVSELLSGKVISVSNRLYDSGYIRQFKYVYENNISGLVAYIIMIRKPQTSGGSNWINITPDSIDQNLIMVTEYPITSDTFEPYQIPTDERFKDYLPLSGGTLTRELTMSGSAVAMKGTNIDLAGDNPTSETWSNSEFKFRDKNNKRAGFINIARGTDGSTRLSIDAQCRKSDNSGDYYNGITIIARRDGTKAYAVSDPASFRAAIGAGTSSFSGSYDDLTNKPNNSITLWEAAEDQAPAAARIPNPNCARYIITVLLGNSSATTFDVDADYIGKTWLDANCGLSTSVDGDNLNFMLAIATGTFDTIKIVKIVGIPK